MEVVKHICFGSSFLTCLLQFVLLCYCYDKRQFHTLLKVFSILLYWKSQNPSLCSHSQHGLSSFFPKTASFLGQPLHIMKDERIEKLLFFFFYNCRGVERLYCLCMQLAKLSKSVSSGERAEKSVYKSQNLCMNNLKFAKCIVLL